MPIRWTTLLLCFLALALPAAAKDVALEWDPNSEPGVAGYRVYYRADAPALPFDGADALDGASPVDVGPATSTVLKGLDDGRIYYFAVTAYDASGYESSYSNIVASDWIPVQKYPENGAVVPTGGITFLWSEPPPDLDVTYDLYLGTDPALSAAAGTLTAAAKDSRYGAGSGLPPAPPFLLLLTAALLFSLLKAGRLRPLHRAASVAGLTLLLASCGGGGGSDHPGPSAGGTTLTSTATGLQGAYFETHGLEPGTYYWKVVADDGGMQRESLVASFKVE